MDWIGRGILDSIDKALLSVIQKGFPLEPRPYEALGQNLSMSESDVIARLNDLRKARIVRQISAIFDTRALGYQSTLVAAKVRFEHLSEAAQVINRHPGVSHNYERDNDFNLWFTIAVPPDTDLKRSVEVLGNQAGATSIRILPTLQLFKIGVTLDVEGAQEVTGKSEPEYTQSNREGATTPFTAEDEHVVRLMQEDLAAVPFPFDPAARELGVSTEELLRRTADLKERGYLRRFAAILYHRKAGFKANCMVVWQIPEDRQVEAGERMGRFSAVSHCYLRPVYKDWPYSLFTMIHGRTRQDCDAVVDAISAEVSPEDVAKIYSVREFKKTRVRYFSPEFEEWDRRNLTPAAQPVGITA